MSLVKFMTLRFYLIKRDFLGVLKFDNSHFLCHLRYKLTQYLIWKVSLMVKTYLVARAWQYFYIVKASFGVLHTGAKLAGTKLLECKWNKDRHEKWAKVDFNWTESWCQCRFIFIYWPIWNTISNSMSFIYLSNPNCIGNTVVS